MGLRSCVACLAELQGQGYEEDLRAELENLAELNQALGETGRVPHDEPTEGEHWSWSFAGYSDLHYLRRLAAYLAINGELPEPCEDDEDPSECDMVDDYGIEAMTGGEPEYMHLMQHSDCDGYYVPLDFDEVLMPGEKDEIGEVMIGSSYRLKEECEQLAAVLELPLNIDDRKLDEVLCSPAVASRFPREAYVCWVLHQAACKSVESRKAIAFG